MVGTVDDRKFGEPLFQIVIFRLAFSQTKPPAVIVDHDADVIRVFERHGTAIERRIIKVPLRRSEFPDQFVKFVPVLFIAGSTTFGGKIKLIPPFRAQPWATTASG